MHETDGCHDIKVDLVGVTVLLSSPPIELLNRSHLMSQCSWPGPIENDAASYADPRRVTTTDHFSTTKVGGSYITGVGIFAD